MPKQLTVHVGYPKAASTWLQERLFPAHPQLENITTKRWWIELIYEDPLAFDAQPYREAYQAQAAQLGDKYPLLSFEGYVGRTLTGGYHRAENAHRLKAVFPQAKILLVIREQIDSIQSAYQQYIKAGGTKTPYHFLTGGYPSPVYFCWDFYRYDLIIDFYAELFGRDALYVVLFEQLKESPQAFSDTIFDFMGIQRIPVTPKMMESSNRSLTRPALSLTRFANRFIQTRLEHKAIIPPQIWHTNRQNQLTQGFLDPYLFRPLGFSTAKGFIPPNLLPKLQEHYRAGNQYLMDQYGLPLDQYGYTI